MIDRNSNFFEIPYYHDYLSPKLARAILENTKSINAVPGLTESKEFAGSEKIEDLHFLVNLYKILKSDLRHILKQRIKDREFLDQRVRACAAYNKQLGYSIDDPQYQTVIGQQDTEGRVVLGPLRSDYCHSGGRPVAPLPDFLQGPHVTLFGPPDSAKMSINAMNSYHRKLKGEPPVVEELLREIDVNPKWGADDEDSKTPLRGDLVEATKNLKSCFDGNLRWQEGEKNYELANEKLALPIKRFPGLALPATFLFFENNPIPLHLYDFAIHLNQNWNRPEALVFYVPKLENEEEAKYIHKMVFEAEAMIKNSHPSYQLGSVRLMIVLENPRAILRTHEIIDALYPYFVGASLGWHDFLGSTARLFKEDSNYRIPVKADPDIVIKYIKASHLLLADVVGSRGGIKVGGMYGVLPIGNDLSSPSFQITLLGFIKDVLIQMKRNLTGFWVAHPDFVRLGMALVSAWQKYQTGDKDALINLIHSLLQKKYHKEVITLIKDKDAEGLKTSSPGYVRSLVVADIKESDFIPNNHIDEIRYNVFQTLQYLADWLSGNGCVALPANIRGIPVRIMDDLATAERSRWEVWHELHHGRFPIEEFIKIAHEEMHFIRKDLSNQKKIVAVKWDEKTSRWYPLAFKIMLKLMTDPRPVEFASELLMPFTIDKIRNSENAWNELMIHDHEKYALTPYTDRLNHYFEVCGCLSWAKEMARLEFLDLKLAKHKMLQFSFQQINEAAFFHGDIGESKKTLDTMAKREQSKVLKDNEDIRSQLQLLALKYQKKFKMKFLISAKDKTGSEILKALTARIKNSRKQEQKHARLALWEISEKRLLQNLGPLQTFDFIEKLRQEYKIKRVSVSVLSSAPGGTIQDVAFGDCDASTWFQLASLSKTLSAVWLSELFRKNELSLNASVNSILGQFKSPFRLKGPFADEVQLEHLLGHVALNMHYVKGFSSRKKMPGISQLLIEPRKWGYEPIEVLGAPGVKFNYSGGGFLVLEHIVECLEKKSLRQSEKNFFKSLALKEVSFYPKSTNKKLADGCKDDGLRISEGRYQFPGFAAGAMGTTHEMAKVLRQLEMAFHRIEGAKGISHDTAVQMLHGRDRGSYEFMGVRCGLGVFVAEAGANRLMIHQGANDGFRALYVHCFSGPDRGKGFVVCAAGENKTVKFIAAVAQELLYKLNFQGVDFRKFVEEINLESVPDEQRVNKGYKNLVFNAFIPDIADENPVKGSLDPLFEFDICRDIQIQYVSNEKFARAENLFSPYLPAFDPELFCRQGKVMDSWETVRHNFQAPDSLHFSFREPQIIRYLSFSTQYHDGNHPESVRLLGQTAQSNEWVEVLAKTQLQGHSELKIKLIEATLPLKNVTVEIYPDGGLSRLRLYTDLPGEIKKEFRTVDEAVSVRFKEPIPKAKKPLSIMYLPPNEAEAKFNYQKIIGRSKKKKHARINLASSAFGAQIVSASNEHYGPAAQVISPYPPLHMFDGLESARSRDPGHYEEVIIEIAKATLLKEIVFDFQFFVNNNPNEIEVWGRNSVGKNIKGGPDWVLIGPRTNVKAFAGLKKTILVKCQSKINQIKVKVFPDGGINRIEVYD